MDNEQLPPDCDEMPSNTDANLGLHQDDPAKVVSAPPRLETFTLDPRLVRMVLRVSPELQEDLITLSERLFDETRLEYSYAAIVRGLIALGLVSIVGKASLAVEFAGARVPRGRKRGERWKRPVARTSEVR